MTASGAMLITRKTSVATLNTMTDSDYRRSNPVLERGFWYWVNDSYVRLKRMAEETKAVGLKPRRLAHVFCMEFYMLKGIPLSRKRRFDEI